MGSLSGYAVIMGGPPPRPEFISQALQDWCSEKESGLHWIELGKPTQNAYIERFNGTFRREVLDAHFFTSNRQVRRVVDKWLLEYNTERPHQALKFMTPVEYRRWLKLQSKLAHQTG